MFSQIKITMWDMAKAPLPILFRRDLIGERIKLVREAFDLRPADLCRLLGFAPNTVSQWESGNRLPNLEDVIRFCEHFGITTDYIYLGKIDGLPYLIARKLGNTLTSEVTPEALTIRNKAS